MKGIKVLSLFDGMSCGQIALDRLGVPVEKYYSSELDKNAMKIAEQNFPETVFLGDVNNWRNWNVDFKKIDLLIGGSPCQGFSFAGKQLNFNDPRSKLFFVYVDILNHIKSVNPSVIFLLENVSMKKEFESVITDNLCVDPIKINSSLVSAQNRKRLYWTNISGVTVPEDKGILLKDIVHELNDEIPEGIVTPNFNTNPSGKGMNGTVRSVNNPKSTCLTTNKGEGMKVSFPIAEYIVPFDKTLQILDKEVQRGKVGYFRKDSQANRVYYIHSKAVTLCGDAGGGAAKMGQYLFGCINNLTAREFGVSVSKKGDVRPHRLDHKKSGISEIGTIRSLGNKGNTLTTNHVPFVHTFDSDYLFGCITPDRIEKRQNGQRFSEGRKDYTLTAQDQHGVLVEGYIRKLTPIECERLQTLPDNYTEGVSNSQRYKMLGNGWTVDVIAHIFSFMKLTENN